ncbi:MAG: sigma-54-dependent Fis family transcriptional regulator [Planctomycetia bacterium]|nr:sigma-54-dependent Fis family transcriptional regulator [Planctomycetia bacterium]
MDERVTSSLLVIDDEAYVRNAFRRLFSTPEAELLTAANAAEGLRLATTHRPQAIVLSLDLPDMPGLEVLARLREQDARTPVIVITGNGTMQGAIEAIKAGAYEFLVKPLGLEQIQEVVGRVMQANCQPSVPGLGRLVIDHCTETEELIQGRCPAMQEVYKAIGRVAPQDIPVLIQGESGTGKELVARAIHQHSRRSDRPFIAINCAAIPEQLLESELFGHEKGAFTGADRRRIGRFEQCSGGTLFLDEIGDMSPLTQAKVLRVIQEKTFERVGGSETLRADVRIISATHRHLEVLAREEKFRGDLYFRLGVFTIALPPLRERGSDLHLLTEHFLRRFSQEMGKEVVSISPEAMDILSRYSWPGNLRELQSVLRVAVLQTWGKTLQSDCLPRLEKTTSTETVITNSPTPHSEMGHLHGLITQCLSAGTNRLYEQVHGRVDRDLFRLVLDHTGGNQLKAAQVLGISRGKLRIRIRKLGVNIGRRSSDKYVRNSKTVEATGSPTMPDLSH